MYVWSIIIVWRDCGQESEYENIVKYVYLDIFIYSKARLIAFASAENTCIVASPGSLSENTYVLITAVAATLFLSFEPSV